jgi:tRNA (Thr-GGU) A37 N-methylase
VSPFIVNNFRLNSKMGVESIGMTKKIKKKRLCPKTKTNFKYPPSNHKQTQFITIASQYSECIQLVFKFSHLIIIPKITNMLNFFMKINNAIIYRKKKHQ